ncbi:MAG: hypothetical protein H7A43_00675 [Verrucomicrobia bacterium]|nr:hypothetical protein [Kiritimatiellia bacterium]MCP5487142.1 hypothetical protein [Verrucomicrobiota bacterium]
MNDKPWSTQPSRNPPGPIGSDLPGQANPAMMAHASALMMARFHDEHYFRDLPGAPILASLRRTGKSADRQP